MDQTQGRRGRRLPLGLLLAALVVGAVSILAGSIIALNYYFDSKLATRAASERFVSIARRGSEAATALVQRGEKMALALANMKEPAVALRPGELHPLVPAMAQLMFADDGVFSLFAGFPGGDYLELSNLDAGADLREAWGAKTGEDWVVVTILTENGERRELRQFLDEDLALRREVRRRSDYFADLRPWFVNTGDSGVSATVPYLLEFVQRRAISYTARSEAGPVVGAIVLLSHLDRILDGGPYRDAHAAMIFNRAGQIIASSAAGGRYRGEPSAEEVRDDTLVYPTLDLLAADSANHAQLRRLRHDGEEYFAYVQPLDAFVEGRRAAAAAARDFIGLLTPAEAVLGSYRDQALLATAASGVVTLCILPLVFLSTRLVSGPIRRLAGESDKVRRRAFAEVRPVPTAIREVAWLSQSITRMATDICDYEVRQKELQDAIVRLIAAAIDQKSPYTGGHCKRVPAIAEELVDAASASDEPPFRDFALDSPEEVREFRIAAWLHDCGKITTPEHIVDKGSKLEALYNRIHEVRMRFEVLRRDAEIRYLRQSREQPEREPELRAAFEARAHALEEDFAFIARCNIGGEAMDDEDIARLDRLATETWTRHFDDRLGLSPLEARRLAAFPTTTPAEERLLADKAEHRIEWGDGKGRFEGLGFTLQPPALRQHLGELYNLTVRRGTLTAEDRYLINEHISSTIEMLETLPWPPELARVPEYAGGHHEKMDGTGYPRSLLGEQLSIPARILAIADVMEALTAPDRPYKQGKTLGESLAIMKAMAREGHLDRDLFRLLLRAGVHHRYAEAFMAPRQRDAVDDEALLAGL